jgi:hypothetical protein
MGGFRMYYLRRRVRTIVVVRINHDEAVEVKNESDGLSKMVR